MKKINLSEVYYFFNHEGEEVLVEDDVYEVMEQYRRSIHVQNEKIRRHKAYYSLDRAPYLENYTVTNMTIPTNAIKPTNKTHFFLFKMINCFIIIRLPLLRT